MNSIPPHQRTNHSATWHLLVLGTVLTFLAACSNPADDVPRAEVEEAPARDSASPQEHTSQSAPPAEGANAARTFLLSNEDGSITFIGSKVTGSHDGGFHKFKGQIHLINGAIQPNDSRVVIDTTSIWSDNDRLTGHLKSADFFDVDQFPQATFVLISVDASGATSTITGDLTLHGITKRISFPATIQVQDDQVQVKADFAINRFDFDMKYPGKADDLIRKEVVIKLNLTAKPDTAKLAHR